MGVWVGDPSCGAGRCPGGGLGGGPGGGEGRDYHDAAFLASQQAQTR